MRRWFLSYHSTDRCDGAAAQSRHRAERFCFPRLLAPMRMRAGCSGPSSLRRRSRKLIPYLLIGKESGSWQVLEYDEALDNWVKAPSDFPLVVVLLEGCTAPGLPFLRRLHWIITLDPASEKDVARVLDAAAGSGSSSSANCGATRLPIAASKRCRRKTVITSLAAGGKLLKFCQPLPVHPTGCRC